MVSFDQNELDIRTAITNLDLDENFYLSESVPKDILIILGQAQISDTQRRRRRRHRGRRAGFLTRLCWRVDKPPLPSVQLLNVQSLENKLDEFRSRLSYQRDLKNSNTLCF